MSPEEIKIYLNELPSKTKLNNILQNEEVLKFLLELYPDDNIPMLAKAKCYVDNLSPYCEVCNAILPDVRKHTCSKKCSAIRTKSTEHTRIEKQKQTLLNKYGVDSVAKIPGMQEKRIESMVKKYGEKISPLSRSRIKERTDDLQVKKKKTMIKKYGVENPGQMKNHREKCKQTLLDNCGEDHYTKTNSFKILNQLRKESKWKLLLPSSIIFNDILAASNEKSLTYNNPNDLINYTCTVCNFSEDIPTETAKWRVNNCGTCCKHCSGIKLGSHAQSQINDFIKSLGYDTVYNDKSTLKNMDIDILIPELKIGFEYHGLYWHNDLKKDKLYHLSKLESSINNGIKLFQIFEDEWIHHQPIVKSRIRYLLKKIELTIYARKCTIREVPRIEAKRFLIENHIQGHANSSIKIGLYLNNELISLMTFSRPSLAKGNRKNEHNVWELSRFCNKLNITVVGGASRLFKYFINNYNPFKIISYADRRWSYGNLYTNIGFTFEKYTEVNYWYVDIKSMTRIYRFNLRKNKDDDQSLSEYENRLKQGYLRIWDCGHYKFIWENKK